MGKKRLFKKVVAGIALVAMLLETGFNDYSMMSNVYAAETSSGEEIEVDTSTIEQPAETQEDASIEVIPVETVENGDAGAVSDDGIDEQSDDGFIMPESEMETEKNKELYIEDGSIFGEGYTDIEIEVLAEDLPRLTYYGLKVYTSAEAFYNGNPIEDNYIESLSSYTEKIYISNLDYQDFEMYFVGESTSDIDFDYTVESIENGTLKVMITSDAVVEDEPEEESEEDEETEEEYSLDYDDGGIFGYGYDAVSVAVEFVTEEDDDDNSLSPYKIYVDTDAEDVTVNGVEASNGVEFDTDTDNLDVEGLDGESFVIYAVAVDDVDMTATYDVKSVDNGKAAITLEFAEAESTKRVYEYEDSKVSVTATLQYADAIPDDAEFVVREIKPNASDYNYDAYMNALNQNADAISDEDNVAGFDETNTLLYDIAFMIEEDGKMVEIQPEDGSVKISIVFKGQQLSEDIAAEESADVTVAHLPLTDSVKEEVDSTADATDISASDVIVDVIPASVSVDGESIELNVDSFSCYAVMNVSVNNYIYNPGTTRTYQDILGSAVNYGLVANTLKHGAHMDTNFATGDMQGNAQVTAGKYTNDHNPGNYIIAEYSGSSGFFTDNGEYKNPFIIYTTEAAKAKFSNNLYANNPNIYIDTTKSAATLKSEVSGMVSGTLSSAIAAENTATQEEKAKNNIYDEWSSMVKDEDTTITGWLDAIYGTDQKYHLDLTDSPAGTYYFGFKPGEYTAKLGQADKLILNLNSDQNVVFNIPDTEVTLQKFTIGIDGKSVGSDTQNGTADRYAQAVTWNIPATNADVWCNNMLGVVLVPNGSVSIGGTSTGWLICNTMAANAGEWHGVWQHMPKSDPTSCSFTIKGIKTVNGQIPNSDENGKFTFELYSWDYTNKTETLIDTAKNNGSTFEFKALDFKDDYSGNIHNKGKSNEMPATMPFGYVVREKQETIDGYTVSKDRYFVTLYVHTTKRADDSYINDISNATVTLADEATVKWGTYDTSEYIKFDNTHVNEKLPADFTLKVKKTFVGDWDPNSDLSKVTVTIEPIEVSATTSGVVPNECKKNWTNSVVLTPNNPEGTFGTLEFWPNFDRSKGWGWDQTYTFDNHGAYKYRTNYDCYMFKITESVENDPSADIEIDIDTDGLTYSVFDDGRGTRYVKFFVNTLTDHHGNYMVGLDTRVKGNLLPNGAKDAEHGGVCDGLTGPIEFKNKKTVNGKIELAKLDENAQTFDGNKLAATFALLKADGSTPVYVQTTNNSGVFEYVSTSSVAYDKDTRNSTFELSVAQGGTVTIDKLPTGTYTLVEVVAPNGYALLKNPVQFTVSANGIVTTNSNVIKKTDANNKLYLGIGVKDERKKVNFKLHKREADANGNATNNAVPKAKFSLVGKNDDNAIVYQQNNIEVDAETGDITFGNLPWGTYTLTETFIPEGYEVCNVNGAMSTTFTVGDGVITGSNITLDATTANLETQTYEGTLYNKKNVGGILLYKYGKNGVNAAENPLAGINFRIVKRIDASTVTAVKTVAVAGTESVNGVSVSKVYEYDSETGTDMTLTTDANGYLYVKGLPAGNYELVEQSPYATAYGYVAPVNIAAATTETTVTANTVVTKNVENNSIEVGVEFEKVDAKNVGTKLAGAEFELYYSETGTSFAKTDKTSTSAAGTGKVSFAGLAAGKYYAKETTPPAGYEATYNGGSYVVYFEVPVNYTAGTVITLQPAELNASGVPTVVTGDAAGVLEYVNGVACFKNDEGTGSASLHKIKSYTNAAGSEVNDNFAGVKFVLKHDTGSFWTNLTQGTVTATLSNGVYTYTGTATAANGTELVTDANGNISITGLPWGNYYFLEVEPDNNYTVTKDYTILDEDYCKKNLSFTIDAAHPTKDFSNGVVNTIKSGKVNLRKVDAGLASDPIADNKMQVIEYDEDGFTFTFDLYNSADELIQENITTTKGLIDDITLPYGSYYFVEKSAGEGYAVHGTTDAEKIAWGKANLAFTIDDSTTNNGANSVTVTAKDYRTKNGQITINKKGTYDADGFVPSAATVPVTFALYSKTNHNVTFTDRIKAIAENLFKRSDYYAYGEYTFNLTKSSTDLNVYTGDFTITDLPWDEYYLVEIEAPDGLVISKEQKAFTIGAGTSHLEYETEVIDNTAAPGGAKIAKHDFETGDIINNGTAYFDVYTSAGTRIRQNITTVSGVAHVGNLQPGDYYFVETQAPAGYTCNSDIKYNFTIVEGATTEVDAIPDTPVTGKVNGSDVSRQETGKAYNKEIPASVTVYKYKESEATGNEFNGVTFRIEKYNGLLSGGWETVATQITSGGKAEFTGLPWGERFRIVETIPDGYNAPEGYTVSNGEAISPEFALGQGENKSLEVERSLVNTQKKAKVTLTKVDEKNRGLAGATFKLVDESGNTVSDNIVSTTSAWTSGDLTAGRYYFVETQAPDLYEIIVPTGFATISSSTDYPNSAADGFKVETVTKDNGSVEYRYWFAIAASDLNGVADGATLASLALTVKNERHTGAFGFKKVDVNTYRTNQNAGLAGAEFVLLSASGNGVNISADGDVAGNYKYDEDSTNTTIVTGENGLAHVSGLPTGTYTLKETKAPAGYTTPDNLTRTITITKNGDDTTYITNPIKNGTNVTSFSFNKKDADGANVSGAVFSLYKKGASGYTYETDFASVNGVVTVTDLYAGEYYVVEDPAKQADDFAYVAPNTPYYFRVVFDANDVPQAITLYQDSEYKLAVASNTVVNDYKKTKLVITKVSLSDETVKLTGAKFALYDGDNTTPVIKEVTNTDGTLEFTNLEVGHTYKLVETQAPNGYRLPSTIEDENKREALLNELLAASKCTNVTASKNSDAKRIEYSFTVTSANVTGDIKVTVPNAPILGALSLRKVDAKDKSVKLSGAQFALYQNGVLKHGPKGTGADGIVNFAELPWGTYDVIETQAPDGYPLVKDYPADAKDKIGKKITTIKIGINASAGENLTWSFTGDENSVTNEHDGGIYIKKQDSTDNSPMANVTFILRKEGDADFRRTVITDENGCKFIDDLGYGSYYLDEEVPTGYEFDAEYTTTKQAEYGTTKNYRRFPAGTAYITISQDSPVSGTAQAPNSYQNNRKKGRVLGYKVNQYGEKVTNNKATFKLYSKTAGSTWELVRGFLGGEKDAWYLGEIKTNDAGEIKIGYSDGEYFKDGLPFGDYVLVETEYPDGFVRNEVRKEFSITQGSEVTLVELGNIENTEQQLSFNLTKKDEAGNVLAGATFALYNNNGTLIEEHALSGDAAVASFAGTAASPIRYGNRYYLVETVVPSGYKRGGDITAPAYMGFENVTDGKAAPTFDATSNEYRYYFTPTIDAAKDIVDGKTITVTAKNEKGYGTVIIQKRFEGNAPDRLDGIVFSLTSTSDSSAAPYTATTDANGVATFTEVAFGTYTLAEDSVPEYMSYSVSTNTKTIVLSDANRTSSGSYVVNDEFLNGGDNLKKARVELYKMSNMDLPVQGMTFKIYKVVPNSNDVYVTSIVTDGTGHAVLSESNALNKGNYYLVEDPADAELFGFEADDTKYYFTINDANADSTGSKIVDLGRSYTEAANGSWTISDLVSQTSPIINDIKTGKVTLVKEDSVSGNGIVGAEFDLYKKGSDGVFAVYQQGVKVDSASGVVITDLPWGSYYFVETKAPEGYVLPEKEVTYPFTIGPATEVSIAHVKATAVANFNFDETVTVDNAPFIKISKRILGEDTLLPGATLVLKTGENFANTVRQWTTGAADEQFTIGTGSGQLQPGVTYRLEETKAPNGYTLAAPVDFTISTLGVVTVNNSAVSDNTVVMYDAPNIEINKYITGTTTRLAGATLEIYNGSNLVERFDTTSAAHRVQANLVPGTTYTLKETSVPAGYLPAEDVNFTVSADGSVNIGDSADKNYTVDMYDKPFEVIINKVLGNGNNVFVAGAQLAIVESGTTNTVANAGSIITEGKPILLRSGLRTNYSDADAKDLNYQVVYGVGLDYGKTYAVLEKSVPNGYLMPTVVEGETYGYPRVAEFTISGDSSAYTQPFECTARNSAFRLILSKEYNGQVLNGAHLQVVDENGNAVTGLDDLVVSGGKKILVTALNQADYAAVYGDADQYQVIYGVALDESKTYYLKETKAPAGYANYDAAGMEIAITGAETTITMEDKPLEIVLEKVVQNAGGKENLSNAHMVLIDETLKTQVWPNATTAVGGSIGQATDGTKYYKTSRKPVIFTQRELDATEAANYAEVVSNPTLIVGHKYIWRELGTVRGFLDVDDYYAGSSDANKHDYIEEAFTLTDSDVQVTRRTVSVYNRKVGKFMIEGTKDWKKAPVDERCSITVNLYRGTSDFAHATLVDSVTLAANALSFKFDNLDRFDYTAEDGPAEYTYYLQEVMNDAAKAANFEWRDSDLKTDANGNSYKEIKFADGQSRVDYTIENFPTEKVSIPVTKEWVIYRNPDGTADSSKEYAEVKIWLKQNNARLDSFVVKNGETKTHVFENLDKYDEYGNLYNYTVEEEGIDASLVDSQVTPFEYSFKITNRPMEDPFYISGTKIWVAPKDDTKPQVEIILYRDGKEYARTDLVDDKFSFGPMYEYNLGWGATDPLVNDPTDNRATADGHKYVYTLKEIDKKTGNPLEDYILSVDFNGEIVTVGDRRVANATLTNTKKQEFVEISGQKFWDDAGVAANRPTVTVNLYQNGVLFDTTSIPNTSTTYSFGTSGKKQLPKYDANGELFVYRVEEAALPGYLSKQNGTDFVNTPSKVRISKVDATNNAELPGAVLSITEKSTGREVERWTSTTTPHYVEGLTLGGEYVLNEITAPAGYAKVDPVSFTVGTNGVEQKVEIRDPRIVGSVTLTKLDAETRGTLGGAAFNLYTAAGALVNVVGSAGSYEYVDGTAATRLLVNDAGTLEVTGLPFGEYYFREIEAPAGYELSREASYFTVSEMGATSSVTFLNRQIRGRARLMKVSSANGAPLAGATFELYAKTPSTTGQAVGGTLFSDVYYLYGTYVTDGSGTITVGDLPWDDYYFIETEAPEGYVLNLDTNGDPLVYTFTVDERTASATVAIDLGSITNTPDGGGDGGGGGATGVPGGGGAAGGVAGVRRLKGSGIGGVLGVRSKPTSGVLGVRVGPTTGDVANIALWLVLLLASLGVIVAICIQAGKKGKSRK